jgi:hypothetical protein
VKDRYRVGKFLPRPVLARACEMVLRSGGRESIFLFCRTIEFCGNSKVARESGVACVRLEHCRWTYEREKSGRAGAHGEPQGR